MALYLRTFPSTPKLRDKNYGEGREYIQRANLVETEKGHGSFFEFRFDEVEGHLPPSVVVPLRIDSFTILREKRKLSDGGEYDRLYLGLDARGDFKTLAPDEKATEFAVEPWSDEVEKVQYGDRMLYRQRVQLFDLASMAGFPFEISSSDPQDVLKAGQIYQIGARNFQQAAYGGLRIDPKSSFVPMKKAA